MSKFSKYCLSSVCNNNFNGRHCVRLQDSGTRGSLALNVRIKRDKCHPRPASSVSSKRESPRTRVDLIPNKEQRGDARRIQTLVYAYIVLFSIIHAAIIAQIDA